MLPIEDVGRGDRLREGSQTGHVDTQIRAIHVVFQRITTAYKGSTPMGLLSLFARAMVRYLHGGPSLLP